MKIEELREKVENEILGFEPIDYIYYIFDRTDENGMVYLQDFPWGELRFVQPEPESIRCKIDWNVKKRDAFVEKFEKLNEVFLKIAEISKDFDVSTENAKNIFKDKTIFEVWQKYIMPIETGNFDDERIDEIYQKIDNVEDVKNIAKLISEGKEVEDYLKDFLTENIGEKVTDEEEKYFEKYRNALYEGCQQRLGKKLCAYRTILHARRLTKLYELGAPEIVTKNEGRFFAQALLLNEYGISADTVDDILRLNVEKFEMMTEEELDEFFRPRKTNNRKSMAPLFVYLILKEKTNVKSHLRQQEILEELKKYPYEISIERKALSRIIHNLMDSQLHIKSDKNGTWFEK